MRDPDEGTRRDSRLRGNDGHRAWAATEALGGKRRKVAPQTGFEPVTRCLEGSRSIH